MRPSFENGKGNAIVNWARIWLDRYHQFLNQEKIPIEVDAPKEHVIAFLFALKQKGKLPWQRIQAVNAIQEWSGSKTGKSAAHLDWIVRQLRKLESLEVGWQNPQDEGDPGLISTSEHPIVERLRAALRRHHDALSTEKAYVGWVKRFNSRFALDDNPEWIGISNSQVEQFLTELAVDSRVAASTQKQAFSSFLYVFRNVLQRDLQGIDALRA